MTIMMHKGSRSVSYEELKEIPTPLATRTHMPIPHADIVDATTDTIGKLDSYHFSDFKFLVSNDGQKFLGSMSVSSPLWTDSPDYDFKIGILSSHDKTFPLTFFAGTDMFICTNRQWSSSVQLSRKHTPNAWDDIHTNLRTLTFEMDDIRKETVNGFEALKDMDFSSQREVHDFVVQSCQKKIIPWQHAPKVLEHWDNPEHHEFKDRNAFSLFNAYTSHARSSNPFNLASTTSKLRTFIDEFKRPNTDNRTTINVRHNESESTSGEVGHSIWGS
jgi:hypothetical protein